MEDELFLKFLGKCLKYWEYRVYIVCSSSQNFVCDPAGKQNFDETEPLLVQYFSESTVFGVKSMSK